MRKNARNENSTEHVAGCVHSTAHVSHKCIIIIIASVCDELFYLFTTQHGHNTRRPRIEPHLGIVSGLPICSPPRSILLKDEDRVKKGAQKPFRNIPRVAQHDGCKHPHCWSSHLLKYECRVVE